MDQNPTIQRTVSLLFEIMAMLLRGRPDGEWSVDLAHPGYLVSSNADGTIAAPFHLIADIPSGEALGDIRSIAQELRIANDSAMCLSGSIVMLSDPHYVGDLDYCEYIPMRQRAASLDRLAHCMHQADSLPICISVKLEAYRDSRPWSDNVCHQQLDKWLGPCTEAGKGKLDLLTERPTTGPVEATNLLLWVPETNSDDYAAMHSFPFQEIVTEAGATTSQPWIPRKLSRPSNIQRYVAFLKDEINSYRRTKPMKALKRALSLATFLMLDDIQEQIIQLGHQSRAFEVEAINQRRALLEMVTTHPDPQVANQAAGLMSSFESWVRHPIPEWGVQHSETFANGVDAIASELLTALPP